MDYRPMFDAIRAGVAIPEEYAFNMIIGRDNEKKLIENDVDYISQTNMSKIRIFMGDYGYGKNHPCQICNKYSKPKGISLFFADRKGL